MQSLPLYPRGFRSCAKNIGIRDEICSVVRP
jgi:hypothetical protein